MPRISNGRGHVPLARKTLDFSADHSPNTLQSSPTATQSPDQPTVPVDSNEFEFVASPVKSAYQLKRAARSPIVHKSVSNKRSDAVQSPQSDNDALLNSTVKFREHADIHEISQQQVVDSEMWNDENVDCSNLQHDSDAGSAQSHNIMALIDGAEVSVDDDDGLRQSLRNAQYNSSTHLLSPARKHLTTSANKLSGSSAKRLGLSGNSGATAKRSLLSGSNESVATVKSIPVNLRPIPVINGRSEILLERAQVIQAEEEERAKTLPRVHSVRKSTGKAFSRTHSVAASVAASHAATPLRPVTPAQHVLHSVPASHMSVHQAEQSRNQSPQKSNNTEFNIYATDLIGSPKQPSAQYRRASAPPQKQSQELFTLQKRVATLAEYCKTKDTEICKLQLEISALHEQIKSVQLDHQFERTELVEENERLREEIAALTGEAARRTSLRSSLPDQTASPTPASRVQKQRVRKLVSPVLGSAQSDDAPKSAVRQSKRLKRGIVDE